MLAEEGADGTGAGMGGEAPAAGVASGGGNIAGSEASIADRDGAS